MLWCWARMRRIQKLIWTFKIGIKRMSTEIWHVPCHLSLQRSTSIISFVSLQIRIYHQEKWLCGWNSTIQRCSLARRREVCISGSSSATISDHGQPVGNMRLIVTRLLWWWRLTTPQLNCSELPWCLADRVSSGSRALRPRHRDPSLTKYSQASTWRSRSKANIIVDLVMLLLKITKALIKLGKTDRPVEKEEGNMRFWSQKQRSKPTVHCKGEKHDSMW